MFSDNTLKHIRNSLLQGYRFKKEKMGILILSEWEHEVIKGGGIMKSNELFKKGKKASEATADGKRHPVKKMYSIPDETSCSPEFSEGCITNGEVKKDKGK